MSHSADKFSLITLIAALLLVVGILVFGVLKFMSSYNNDLIYNKFDDSIDVENDSVFHDKNLVKTWNPAQYDELSRLFFLCKVWGFAKYFGNDENADELLLASLDKLLNDNEINKNDYCNLLENIVRSAMIDSVKSENHYQNIDDYSLISNDWMNDTICLNENVKKRLEVLLLNYNGNNHFAKNRKTGIVKFNKTDDYQDVSNPSVRLFGLFDYWNAMNYFYPSKNLIDCSWDSVLYESIPRFVEASDERQYRMAIYRLTNRLCDSHASYPVSIDTFVFGEFRPLFRMSLIDNAFVINELRNVEPDDSDFKIGDVILKIDGENPQELYDSHGRFVCGGNYWSNQYFVCNAMLSRKEKSTDFMVLRGEDTLNLKSHNEKSEKLWRQSLRRDKRNESKQQYKWINDKTAYLDFKSLTHRNFQDNFAPIKEADTLILDLRCYPEQLLAVDVADYFVPANSTSANYVYADARFPGMLRIHQPAKRIGTNKCFKGKIIVLVDENTGSYSEYLTMMIQANPNTAVVGMPTSGAVGNADFYYFPGEVTTVFTGIRVLYPDLRETQRIGIKLDVLSTDFLETYQ